METSLPRDYNSGARGPPPSNMEESLSEGEKESKFSQIKIFHFLAFLFLGMQTIVYGVMSSDTTVRPTVGFPIECHEPICIPSMRVLGKINPFFIITLFVAVGSFGHLLIWTLSVACPDTSKQWFFTYKTNPIRWLQCSVTGSVMAVAVSIFSGIQDVHIWYLIFMMHAIAMLLGFILEIIPRQSGDNPASFCDCTIRWLVFLAAFLSIFLAWMVLFCYFFYSVDKAADEILDFRYVAFAGTFFLFICIAGNAMFCNVLKLYQFHNAEITYVILGVLAQTLLAADIFGGIRAYRDY